MPSSPGKEIEEAAASLRLVVARLARRLRQQSLHGLTPSQISILSTLERQGPLRMGVLARMENITPPSLTGIVARLEDKELVHREPDPEDRRSMTVTATASGLEAIKAIRRERTAFLVGRMMTLRHQELETLKEATAVLDRLVDQ